MLEAELPPKFNDLMAIVFLIIDQLCVMCQDEETTRREGFFIGRGDLGKRAESGDGIGHRPEIPAQMLHHQLSCVQHQRGTNNICLFNI